MKHLGFMRQRFSGCITLWSDSAELSVPWLVVERDVADVVIVVEQARGRISLRICEQK